MSGSEKKRKSASWVLVLFGLPFALVGLVMGFFAIRHLASWYEARSWVSVPAEIYSLELERHHSDGSTTFSIAARYEYTVQGRTFEGDRVWFGSGSDNVGDFQEESYQRLRRAREAGEVRAYVDPDDPRNAVLIRALRPGLVVFQLTFLLLFGGVGFGCMAARTFVRRAEDFEEEAKRRYPNEPWRWEKRWAGDRIRSSDRSTLFFWTAFALIWNGISWPIVPSILDEAKHRPVALIALLFPIVGTALAIVALRSYLRWRRFGISELALSPFPAPLGGRVTGRVLVPTNLRDATDIRLQLDCHRSSGSGKNQQTTLLWQDERPVPAARIAFDGRHSTIPLDLPIPADHGSSADDRIRWTLTARADLAGVDYHSTFELPVFSTAHDFQGIAPPPPFPSTDDDFSRAPDTPWPRGITIEPLPEGGRRYTFRSNRFPIASFGSALFLAIWIGGTYASYRLGAPKFFPVLFGLFGAIPLYAFTDLVLRRRRIVASSRGLEVHSALLLGGKTRRFTPQEISTLRVERGLQLGNRLLQRVVLVPKSGKKVVAASHLDSVLLAQKLIRQLRDDLDLA